MFIRYFSLLYLWYQKGYQGNVFLKKEYQEPTPKIVPEAVRGFGTVMKAACDM
jgi:hypothetical protein